MKLRYETARLMIYKVGWLMQENKSTDMDAAMAKLIRLGIVREIVSRRDSDTRRIGFHDRTGI